MAAVHRANTLSRRQVVQGAGVAALGLLAGCERLPWQPAPPARVSRIGWLSDASAASEASYRAAFQDGLRELGYVEGQNVVVESRWVESTTALPLASFAAELIRLPVDVIVAINPISTQAASRATSSIPIVMATGGDPVRLGLAASLARPGGNVTGLSTLSPALSGKRLELLRDAVPGITRVGIVADSTNPSGADQWGETQIAAQTLGLQVFPLELRESDDLEGLLTSAGRERMDALCTLAVNFGTEGRGRLIEFAAENKLPAMYFRRLFVDEGGLMAYGPNLAAMVRRSAIHVDKLLRGAKPAELPIDQVMTFDFVINLQAARALGLTVPQHVLLQATEIIQ
ncbi:MAG TPA: ABC transporter substrate-binding protein [Chloroflexota bacterium]|jgi:putative ABC transport system substrate-binding protein